MTRITSCCLLAGACCLLALTLPAAPASGADWGQFGFSARQTRANPFERTLGVSNVARLAPGCVAGSAETSSGYSPAVARGRLYTTGIDSRLHAYDARSCAELWSAHTSERWGINTSPAVAGGIVYVGTYRGLVAFDAATGAVRWYALPEGPDSRISEKVSPTVAGGRVFIGSHATLYAFDALTGALLWKRAMQGMVTSPAVADGRVFVSDDRMRAFSASTGRALWTKSIRDAEHPFASLKQAAVSDGRVYVSDSVGRVWALDAASGAIRWKADVILNGTSEPAVAGDRVYIGTYDSFSALEAGTGALAWTVRGKGGFTAPAVANGVVYASACDGSVYGFDAGTGATLWRAPIVAGVRSCGASAVVNGRVYVTHHDREQALHRVYTFKLPAP